VLAGVSAAPVREAGEEAEGELRLTKHSYRAGLWDAKTFTNHYWAESYRRGVEKAKRIVCINDGAIWIWMMVFVCFSRRIEILDWWHMLQYVWQIAAAALGPDSSEASAWVQAQKAALTRSQLRLFFRRILRLYPNPAEAPPEVKQAVAYLWKNRRRMNYAAYRKAGFHQQRHRRIRCQNLDSAAYETSWHALVPKWRSSHARSPRSPPQPTMA